MARQSLAAVRVVDGQIQYGLTDTKCWAVGVDVGDECEFDRGATPPLPTGSLCRELNQPESKTHRLEPGGSLGLEGGIDGSEFPSAVIQLLLLWLVAKEGEITHFFHLILILHLILHFDFATNIDTEMLTFLWYCVPLVFYFGIC